MHLEKVQILFEYYFVGVSAVKQYPGNNIGRISADGNTGQNLGDYSSNVRARHGRTRDGVLQRTILNN